MKLKRPELFWSKVDCEHPSGCWLWAAAIRQGTGYGHFQNQLAHRVAYELTLGPIPDGMWVLHTCDVKRCVNPEHLYVGTSADNTRDAVVRDRVVFGEQVFGAKLAPNAVAEIRSRRATGETLSLLATHFGVTEATISHIALRKTWRRVA